MLGGWGADHTDHFWHHPLTPPAVVVWKAVSQHLFLNIIPSNLTVGSVGVGRGGGRACVRERERERYTRMRK